MQKKPTTRIWMALSLLMIASLACNLTGPAPSATPPATPTLPPPTATPLPPINPTVIDHDPVRGDELPTDAPITVYFDSPMNHASVEAAFKIEPAVNGAFSWPNDSTLIFKPSAALERAARYVVTIAESAQSQAGLVLRQPYTFKAETVGFLEVTQVIPAPDTYDVAVDSSLTIMFNRPVVALTALSDQANLPNPLTLDPSVSGTGEWLNTSIYVFRPDVALSGGQLYTARIAAGLQDTTGGLLQNDFVWSFTTLSPAVVSSFPAFGDTNVGLTQPISLTFNQPMEHASTEAAFALLTPEHGNAPGAPGAFRWSEDGMTMGFWPSGRLPYGASIVATLNTSARAASGAATLAFPFETDFSTVIEPGIIATSPSNGETFADSRSGFRIYFASPMEVSTLDAHIEIVPQPTAVYTYWGDYDLSYYIGWNLEPSTSYTVRLTPGMADPYGTTINEGREINFTTAPLPPEAYFNASNVLGTYSAYAPDTVIYITSLNVDAASFELYRLSLNDFAALTGPNSYDAYQRYAPSDADAVRRWSLDIPHALNERTLTRVPLASDGGGALTPGTYFLRMTVPGMDYQPYQLMVVAQANVTLKTGFDEALMWVTDIQSGQPAANVPVALYDRNFNYVAGGQTDADGLFSAAVPERDNLWDAVYAISGDEEFGLTVSDWAGGVEAWDFGLSGQYYKQTRLTYLYTDRPLYRPGQVVYFKGVVRNEDDARFSLPDMPDVDVTITNQNGEEVYKDTLSLNAFGTFSGEFKLGDEAGLGYYSIGVMRGDDYVGGNSFSVAEYRKPEFQVAVSAPEAQVAQGATIPASVDATFFFGGPVSNADVHWTVLSADYIFPFKGRGYYDFYNYDYSAGGIGPQYGVYGQVIAEKDGKTDAQGHATFDVKADLSSATMSQLFTIEATITDLNGQSVSGRMEVVVHQGRFYVGVRPQEYVGTAGQSMAFDLTTVNWESDPFPNQPLTVQYYDHQWHCAMEQDPDSGSNVWTCDVEDTLVHEEAVTTDAKGLAVSSFIPPEGGVYQVRASGKDADGHTVTASTIVWVASDEFISWRQDNNDRITLVTDRKSYKPGDTAEILIPSPFQGEATALVTVERGHIIQKEVLRLTTNSTLYRLPITADFAPDVFVSVVIMKGVDENNPTSAFKLGLAKLSVSPEQQQITVTLTPDKTKVGPRDTVTYALKATDYLGQPVQAEFSLSLVDLAVLSLSAPNSGPILDAFYGERGLGIRTATGLTLSVDRLNVAAERAKGGGGGADEGFNEVRSRFLDTAYWNATVTTNANGEASVAITLPDNLTTWRMDVRGVSSQTLVGQATIDIVATKDLLIRPNTPRFFVVGDKATLGAVVNNNTAQAIQATVTLAGTGVDITSPAAQTITINANDRAEVNWNVTAQDAEYADLTFSVEGGGLKDSSKPTLGLPPEQHLPIYQYSAPETVGTAGQLDSANSVLEAVSLPRRYDATQGSLDIQLDPSLAASMTGALDYLEHFPYECTEQTVSRFLPNVLTFRALKDLGLANPELEANLTAQLNIGLQRLYAQQHYDGGWGWWAEDESDPYISAYVVFGLIKAEQSGFAVSASVLELGLSYLRGQILSPDFVATNENWLLNRQAFILYALAEGRAPETSATVNLYEARTRLDTYARAYLALTLALIDSNDARVLPILSDINNAAILSATGAHWEEATRDWWNMNTDTRSTAIVLDALVRLDPSNNLIPNVVRWLMVARKAQAWETTQETAWALIALTDWMVVSGELKANYDYSVSLNGNALTSGAINADNLRDPVRLHVAVADLLRDQANQLTINRGQGDGRLYYTAHLNLYLPVEEVRALSRGVMVSRQYTLVSDDCGGPKQPECPAVTQAQAGQDIQVKVTLIAPNDLYYVVLEDPIPAGAEPIDTSLLTTSIVGQPPALDMADPLYYGWGWWWFSRSELRDEKVVLFANYLPKGTYEYTYTLHALLPGEYKVIPTHAKEFYFPEVFGRGDGLVFTITP